MTSPNQMNVSFRHLGTDYHINLVQGKKSDHTVEINGMTYAVLGDKDKLKTACEILNSIPLRDISNLEDLKGSLSKLNNLSFLFHKANEFGVDSLRTRSIASSEVTEIHSPQQQERGRIIIIGGHSWQDNNH